MSARQLDVGLGFVRAKECPACSHTRCGEDCACNCDAERAENAAAVLLSQRNDLLAACEAALEVMNTAEEFHDGAEGTDARLAMESAVARVRGGK